MRSVLKRCASRPSPIWSLGFQRRTHQTRPNPTIAYQTRMSPNQRQVAWKTPMARSHAVRRYHRPAPVESLVWNFPFSSRSNLRA
jgi:hypothetical protein